MSVQGDFVIFIHEKVYQNSRKKRKLKKQKK
jgi:hypothetical protein